MTKSIYNFQKQLNKSNLYENIVCSHFGMEYVGDKVKAYDCLYENKKIELKIDFHKNNRRNFFFEHYSNDTKAFNDNNFGGPWRAVRDQIDEIWYCHVDRPNIHIYKFDPKQLISHLDKILYNLEVKTVRNNGYNTLGYAINIDKLINFFIKETINNEFR